MFTELRSREGIPSGPLIVMISGVRVGSSREVWIDLIGFDYMVLLLGAEVAVFGFKFYESKDFVCNPVYILGEVTAYELCLRCARFPLAEIAGVGLALP